MSTATATSAKPIYCDGCGEEIKTPGTYKIFIGGGQCHDWCVQRRNENMNGRRVTFDHETYINGVRFAAGDYLVKRMGPPQPEPSF